MIGCAIYIWLHSLVLLWRPLSAPAIRLSSVLRHMYLHVFPCYPLQLDRTHIFCFVRTMCSFSRRDTGYPSLSQSILVLLFYVTFVQYQFVLLTRELRSVLFQLCVFTPF